MASVRVPLCWGIRIWLQLYSCCVVAPWSDLRMDGGSRVVQLYVATARLVQLYVQRCRPVRPTTLVTIQRIILVLYSCKKHCTGRRTQLQRRTSTCTSSCIVYTGRYLCSLGVNLARSRDRRIGRTGCTAHETTLQNGNSAVDDVDTRQSVGTSSTRSPAWSMHAPH